MGIADENNLVIVQKKIKKIWTNGITNCEVYDIFWIGQCIEKIFLAGRHKFDFKKNIFIDLFRNLQSTSKLVLILIWVFGQPSAKRFRKSFFLKNYLKSFWKTQKIKNDSFDFFGLKVLWDKSIWNVKR
jgi:hypothetical protein